MSKWKSRKFWLSLLAVIGTVAITLGADPDKVQMVGIGVADAVVAVWVAVEGIIDAIRAKNP